MALLYQTPNIPIEDAHDTSALGNQPKSFSLVVTPTQALPLRSFLMLIFNIKFAVP
jgi:hypothetical protein